MRLNKLLVAFLVLGLVACSNTTKAKPHQTIKDHKYYEEMHNASLSDAQIKKYLSYDYFKIENLNRYIAYDASSIKDKIISVNMSLDKKPYSEITILKNDSITELVNKYNGLKEGYEPSDLVEVSSVCTKGEEYGCHGFDKLMLRKEASDAFNEFVEAGKKQNLTIKAISGYRSFEYQDNLWKTNAQNSGEAYADEYFARAGTSEHNTGLAVDLTFNDYNFNEIENYEGYDWILNNAHKYGFILRYPKDKTSETLYSYESWHFRYVGKKLAKELYDNNESLEYYYATK